MYSHIQDSHLRYALRVYFIGGMFVLAIIGNQCCKCAAKLDLLKGKQVDLHRMTGWLHPKETIYCIWKLKRLPGGLWLGLMMIVASIVTIAADFATNSIKEHSTIGRCKFDTGLVTQIDDRDLLTWSSPPDNGLPAVRTANAQSTSFRNGCKIGVYKKIPGFDDPAFCAGEDDIYGSWTCVDLNKDHTFDPRLTETQIMEWMVKNGVHPVEDIANISSASESTLYLGEVISFSHLILWSIYADNFTTPIPTPVPAWKDWWPIYHVRVSIDLNSTDSDPKFMKTFECNVTSDNDEYRDGIIHAVSAMTGEDVLNSWSAGLNAKVYAGSGVDASPVPQLVGNVSQYLNSLTMVMAGDNSMFNSTLPSDVPLYGCVIMRTWLSPGVIFLACFTGLCLVGTTTYYITLLALLGRHGFPSCCVSREKRVGLNLDTIPDSTLSWMLHASRERGLLEGQPLLAGVPDDEKDLNNWSIVLVQDGQGTARLVRTNGDVASVPIAESGSSSPPLEQIPLSTSRKDSESLHNTSYTGPFISQQPLEDTSYHGQLDNPPSQNTSRNGSYISRKPVQNAPYAGNQESQPLHNVSYNGRYA